MKILTYNILNGGQPDRLPLILEVIASAQADIVCLQETNGFDALDRALLKSVAKVLDCPYYAFAPCETVGRNYSVSTYARLPIQQQVPLPAFQYAGIVTFFRDTLAVCNVLLSSTSDDERIGELRQATKAVASGEKRIICGDHNMLSSWDSYNPALPGTFNEKQCSRFTKAGTLEIRAAQFLAAAGYQDVAEIVGVKGEWTVRTRMSTAEGHPLQARLDYAFVSPSLAEKVRHLEVIRTPQTDCASDHYPVLVTFDEF